MVWVYVYSIIYNSFQICILVCKHGFHIGMMCTNSIDSGWFERFLTCFCRYKCYEWNVDPLRKIQLLSLWKKNQGDVKRPPGRLWGWSKVQRSQLCNLYPLVNDHIAGWNTSTHWKWGPNFQVPLCDRLSQGKILVSKKKLGRLTVSFPKTQLCGKVFSRAGRQEEIVFSKILRKMKQHK